MLTAERLREVLHYDPETGLFTWRVALSNRCVVGNVAGSTRDRYVRIRIDGKIYYGHRLAVLYVTGEWPTKLVDHRYGDKLNNRWKQLREAAPAQNLANIHVLRPSNTSGFTGVSRDRRRGRWVANMKVRGVHRYLGSFDDPALAHAAYAAAKTAEYGEFSPYADAEGGTP